MVGNATAETTGPDLPSIGALFLLALCGLIATQLILGSALGPAAGALGQLLFFLAVPMILSAKILRWDTASLHPWRIALPVLPLAAALVPLTVLLIAQFESFQELYLFAFQEDYLQIVRTGGLLDAPPAILWLSLALMPAIAEEYLFRGMLLGALSQRLNPTAALLLSSALFALTHAPVQIWLPIFLLGLALGLLRMATGSLLPSIGAHLLNNCIAVDFLTGDGQAAQALSTFRPMLFLGALAAFAGVAAGAWALTRRGRKGPVEPGENRG